MKQNQKNKNHHNFLVYDIFLFDYSSINYDVIPQYINHLVRTGVHGVYGTNNYHIIKGHVNVGLWW